MKGLRHNIKALLATFVVMFIALTGYIAYTVTVNGTSWFLSPYNLRLSAQKKNVIPGNILDRDYNVLVTSDAESNRVYSDDETLRRAMSHVLGDPYGIAASGIETFHAKYLLGFNTNVFERIYQAITMEKRHGDTVVTTLDSELCKYIYQQMDYNGAVVVMNYRTGEILAMVSNPSYDPLTVEDYRGSDASDSVLVNRATMGKYTPGSVFKIVTTAAILRDYPALADETFTCTGTYACGTGEVVCYHQIAHGEQTLQEAFANSCNCAFAHYAETLGHSALLSTAERLGFNKDFIFDDLSVYRSSYETPGEEQTLEFAWSAIGQYKDTVTPMHMCMLAAAVANDGVMLEPKLVKSIMNARNYEYITLQTEEYGTVLSSEEAQTLRELMINAVTRGTAKNAAVKGYTIGGKTGTAEVSDDKTVEPHSWFVGFVDDETHPIAIAVVCEYGGAGSAAAAPLASRVFEKAIELGY